MTLGEQTVPVTNNEKYSIQVFAIMKSAEHLRDLRKQFGSLGLAAAAYNAGPKRVQDWLAHARGLPQETEAYVRIVTGRSALEWRTRDLTLSFIAHTRNTVYSACIGCTYSACA